MVGDRAHRGPQGRRVGLIRSRPRMASPSTRAMTRPCAWRSASSGPSASVRRRGAITTSSARAQRCHDAASTKGGTAADGVAGAS